MGLGTWVIIGVVALVVIGLGWQLFLSGLVRGAEKIGENPAVQNVTETAKEFVEDKIDAQVSNSAILEIKTEKMGYERGEPVVFVVTNNGDDTLTFSDSALGLRVTDVDSNRVYGVIAAQVITELKPGDSKSITWNQEDSEGNIVDVGTYSATVSTIPSEEPVYTAEASFAITE